ncbi:unnamed protein product [Camellia sinensis]
MLLLLLLLTEYTQERYQKLGERERVFLSHCPRGEPSSGTKGCVWASGWDCLNPNQMGRFALDLDLDPKKNLFGTLHRNLATGSNFRNFPLRFWNRELRI